MLLGHFSDIHGPVFLRALLLGDEPQRRPDLWVCTGDFFPNRTRGISRVEQPVQRAWFGMMASAILKRLDGVPLVWCPGNHDYIELDVLLRRHNVPAYRVKPEGVTVKGVRFAGFRQIPRIAGEWNGEAGALELSELSARAILKGKPDVLVTHAPPAHILDGGHRGIEAIPELLRNGGHTVRAHLFGHVHECGGRSQEFAGVRYYNSATTLQWIEL